MGCGRGTGRRGSRGCGASEAPVALPHATPVPRFRDTPTLPKPPDRLRSSRCALRSGVFMFRRISRHVIPAIDPRTTWLRKCPHSRAAARALACAAALAAAIRSCSRCSPRAVRRAQARGGAGGDERHAGRLRHPQQRPGVRRRQGGGLLRSTRWLDAGRALVDRPRSGIARSNTATAAASSRAGNWLRGVASPARRPTRRAPAPPAAPSGHCAQASGKQISVVRQRLRHCDRQRLEHVRTGCRLGPTADSPGASRAAGTTSATAWHAGRLLSGRYAGAATPGSRGGRSLPVAARTRHKRNAPPQRDQRRRRRAGAPCSVRLALSSRAPSTQASVGTTLRCPSHQLRLRIARKRSTDPHGCLKDHIASSQHVFPKLSAWSKNRAPRLWNPAGSHQDGPFGRSAPAGREDSGQGLRHRPAS